MTKPNLPVIPTIIPRSLYLLSLLLISACAAQNQASFTAQAVNGGQDELFFVGRDPEHKDRSFMRVKDVTLSVFDSVKGPSPDSMHLLNHTHINTGDTVLDLGTGTGVQAIFAARKAKHVVATDISPQAGENARINIKKHKLEKKIDVRVGDLFAPLEKDERFDVVLLNLRYPTRDANEWLWKLHERFFSEVKDHLNPDGRIYYQFGFLRNLDHVEKMLADNQLYIADKRLGISSVIKNSLFLTFEIRALPETAKE